MHVHRPRLPVRPPAGPGKEASWRIVDLPLDRLVLDTGCSITGDAGLAWLAWIFGGGENIPCI